MLILKCVCVCLFLKGGVFNVKVCVFVCVFNFKEYVCFFEERCLI